MDKDALCSVFSGASRDGWSLRSDVQLQECLEDFAERLKSRTKEVAAEVHRLGTETGNVELLLQNNLNSLRALSATQFIENRVDEVDEVFVNKSEQPIRQSRVESYDSQIIPRYKEAVLTAWDAFEEFSARKTNLQTSDVRLRMHQTLQTKPLVKLPHIIGTEEFSRDPHCGLADFKFLEVNARASSSEPVESGSDTDRDEARMAAEMVGERTWLEGEWSATESEASGHQGGVLEPAVSAALDFKAMLEAALRGPSFAYDRGSISNLENAHVQHSYVENASTLSAHDTDSNTPRTRSSPKESTLDGDLSTKNEHTPVEHSVQYQNQGLASEVLEEPTKTELLQPPIHMPPALSRNDYALVAGSIGLQSPWTSTPTFTPSPLDGFADDPEPSPEISSSSGSPPKDITSTASIRNNTIGTSLPLNLHTEESKLQQPASEYRPSAVSDDLPMPTLPDGLFQGLQAAMQARQLRSQRNELPQEGKEATQRPGMGVASVSAEKPFVASRSPPVKLNLKESKSKSKVETASRFQKGASASKPTPAPISFQGGLFDDDDLDEMSDFLSKEDAMTPEFGAKQFGENQGPPLTAPLTSGGSSMVRKGLFDDFGDFSRESPSESEIGGATSSGLVQRVNAATSQQSVLSLPDRKDANRSRVLKKSLFGDSDEEDNDLFGD